MDDDALGTRYADGEAICRQGEPGDRMYVMQAGRAVVTREDGSGEIVLGELNAGDIFGEMAIFDREPRSATVRASGTARVLTLDKRGFLKRVHEDPSLAYRILRDMSRRLRSLNQELSRARVALTGPPRYLLVVSREQPELHARLSGDFARDPAVEVVADRRGGERQQQGQSGEEERAGADRRRQQEFDAMLAAHGFMIVRRGTGS